MLAVFHFLDSSRTPSPSVCVRRCDNNSWPFNYYLGRRDATRLSYSLINHPGGAISAPGMVFSILRPLDEKTRRFRMLWSLTTEMRGDGTFSALSPGDGTNYSFFQ